MVGFEGAAALTHVAIAQLHGIQWIWACRHSRVRMAPLLQVHTAASLPVLGSLRLVWLLVGLPVVGVVQRWQE